MCFYKNIDESRIPHYDPLTDNYDAELGRKYIMKLSDHDILVSIELADDSNNTISACNGCAFQTWTCSCEGCLLDIPKCFSRRDMQSIIYKKIDI